MSESNLFTDGDFHDTLDEMAQTIDPKESKDLPERSWKGKLVDRAILLRKGFQQVWQFLVIIQALFIFLGLSESVSEAIHAITGIRISGKIIGVIALFGLAFTLAFGMFLLLIGGTQRATFLVNQKQNPAQRMDYEGYRRILVELRETKRKVEELEADQDE